MAKTDSSVFTANLKTSDDKTLAIERKTKDIIKLTVSTYIELAPQEYEIVCRQIAARRWELADMEFGTVQGRESKLVERALFEIPETLFDMIVKNLDLNQLKQFKGLKGSRWFAKQFPMFTLPNSI